MYILLRSWCILCAVTTTQGIYFFPSLKKSESNVTKLYLCLFFRKLSSKAQTTRDFYSKYNIEKVGPVQTDRNDSKLSTTEASIIAVACILGVAAVVLAIALCYWCKRYIMIISRKYFFN